MSAIDGPSAALIVALREVGVPQPYTETELRRLIHESLGAHPPLDRSVDDLAHAVLGLARVGMLRAVAPARRRRGGNGKATVPPGGY